MQNCSNLLHFILFADDTNLLCSNHFELLVKVVNEELEKLSAWFVANKLSLNIKKTNYILFGRKKKTPSNLDIMINGEKLIQVSSTKFLGVNVGEKLNWKSHIDAVSKKIARSLGIINKLRHKLNLNTLLTLYHTMVHPHLYYCTIIWGGTYIAQTYFTCRALKKEL